MIREFRILHGDAVGWLKQLPPEFAHCCVTSPPYFGLRDYGIEGQIGLEPTPEEYVARMVDVFRGVRRVLRNDATLWLNLGDSYAGGGGFSVTAPTTSTSKSGKYGLIGGLKAGGIRPTPGIKAKDLLGVPWRVAFALQADGWYLRSDIIWAKPNPMPESVTDRPTKAHEYLFLLTKSERYYYDADAIAEACETEPRARDRNAEGYNVSLGDGRPRFSPGSRIYGLDGTRNKRSVWTVATQPYPESHFATFPEDLIKPCILAGSPEDGVVLDPFMGSGTTGVVALRHGRKFVGTELNPSYCEMARRRITNDAPLFNTEHDLTALTGLDRTAL